MAQVIVLVRFQASAPRSLPKTGKTGQCARNLPSHSLELRRSRPTSNALENDFLAEMQFQQDLITTAAWRHMAAMSKRRGDAKRRHRRLRKAVGI
jgi:hypothetical protein